MELTPPECPFSTRELTPLFTFQMPMDFRPPEAIYSPSGENFAQYMLKLCPTMVSELSPRGTFHISMVWLPNEATRSLSGEKSTAQTLSVWPPITFFTLPVLRLQRITLKSRPAEARYWPSGEIAIVSTACLCPVKVFAGMSRTAAPTKTGQNIKTRNER